jgi:hypothetical protein
MVLSVSAALYVLKVFTTIGEDRALVKNAISALN